MMKVVINDLQHLILNWGNWSLKGIPSACKSSIEKWTGIGPR